MLNSEIGQKPKLRIRMKAVPATPLPPKTSADRLAALIESSITLDPFELNGNQWCRMSHADRAGKLGVTARTIRRLIQAPPFVHTTRGNTTFVRVGEPSPEDRTREIAIILTALWRKHLDGTVGPKEAAFKAEIEALKATIEAAEGAEKTEAKKMLNACRKSLARLHITRETPKEFGLLNGLANEWPAGLQVELFKLVLSDWSAFMAAAKGASIENPPETGKAYKRALEELHFKFPNLAVVRLFASVAVDLLVMKHQEKGQKADPPAALVALNPAIWAHLKA